MSWDLADVHLNIICDDDWDAAVHERQFQAHTPPSTSGCQAEGGAAKVSHVLRVPSLLSSVNQLEAWQAILHVTLLSTCNSGQPF